MITKIKNFDLINKEISEFTWHKFILVSEIHFYKVLNKYYEELPILDLTIEYVDVGELLVKLRFIGVENLQISSTYNLGIQLSSFNVIDIREDGCNDLNYKVYDYESENLKFYCSEVEVISIIRA